MVNIDDSIYFMASAKIDIDSIKITPQFSLRDHDKSDMQVDFENEDFGIDVMLWEKQKRNRVFSKEEISWLATR